MRIPPYHKRKGYQRFLAGILLGFFVGWVFFLINYGLSQEEYISRIKKQHEEIGELERQIKNWTEDQEKMNEENEKKLKLQEITITFVNNEQLKISQFTEFELEREALRELEILLNKDIESISQNQALLMRLIENKIYTIDNESYQLKVHQLYLYTTLKLYLKIERVR
jgi:hypothetical protein